MRAVVLALADLGRSARMQYHARALIASGMTVDFVGLAGTPLPLVITEDSRIRLHRIAPSSHRWHRTTGVTYAIAAVFDTLLVAFRLWRVLRRLETPTLVVVQNPPAFPTVAVARWCLKKRGVRFVTDWHILGYTVLRLRRTRCGRGIFGARFACLRHWHR